MILKKFAWHIYPQTCCKKNYQLFVSILSWLEQQTSVIKHRSISCVYRVCWEWWGGIWKSQNSASWFLSVLWAPVTALHLMVCQIALWTQFSHKVNKTDIPWRKELHLSPYMFLCRLALKILAWWNWVSAALHVFSSPLCPSLKVRTLVPYSTILLKKC